MAHISFAALPLVMLGFGGSPDLCSTDDCGLPKLPIEVAVEVQQAEPDGLAPYDYDVDAEIFVLYVTASDLCDFAVSMRVEGYGDDDIVDGAIDVFTDEGLVTTTESVYYLHGLLVGCLV
jgi:hypothetical protein